ncbi:MAG: NADH-quinone oxidoreductase subunit J [Akkermansiaceae bacterium]|nr:NADH-quinone oxidoreductase subunit J [Akkermansiaceae bacterium]
MPTPLFWFFAILMLAGGLAVVSLRNPVSSALAMVTSFVGLAGLFIGLNAFFVGVIQILVYAGAIMVLADWASCWPSPSSC